MKKIVILAVYFLSFIISKGQQPKLMLPIGHTWSITNAIFSPDGTKILTISNDESGKIWEVISGKLLVVLKGHSESIHYAEFSQDGKKIVTASEDRTAKIWDAQTGNLLIRLIGHDWNVETAVFSPDSKKIVTASWDHTAKIWDAQTGNLLRTLSHWNYPSILGQVHSASFSPDGKRIVTACEDHTARIWDANTGDSIKILKGHKSVVGSAFFSPDGKRIITSSSDRTAKIWDYATGSLIADLTGHKGELNSASFSPDRSKIVTSAYFDNDAKLWNAFNGKLIANLSGHTKEILSTEFSPDGKKIISASEDGTAKMWTASNGEIIRTFKGHKKELNSASFSPDGKKIVTSSPWEMVKIWDVVTGNVLKNLKGHTSHIVSGSFSPDGKRIVIGTSDYTAKVWDIEKGILLANLKGHPWWVKSVVFNRDGKKILTISDNIAKIWDADTYKLISDLSAHNGPINSIRLSEDGKKIVTASDDSTAKVWDAETYKLLFTIKGHSGEINSANFSPDGMFIATASDDNTVKVWSAITGDLQTTLKHDRADNPYLFPRDILSAVFSPNSKKIIAATDYGDVKIWDPITGNLLADLPEEDNVQAALFSPDGNKIVTASGSLFEPDSVIKIWDSRTNNLLFNLKGHNRDVNSALFSSDGKKLVTASKDHSAKIWDVSNGKILFDLQGHDFSVISALFSPDDKKVLTISADNTCRIWNSATGKLFYTFFPADSAGYIVLDEDNRYDGTEAARELLYFVCNGEIIELDQLKDQLWVPNLAERIMKEDSINATTLSDLDICNLIPLVEQISTDDKSRYHYKITSRRGGLGETVLHVNGIEARRYKASELLKTKNGYELIVPKSQLQAFLKAGEENKIVLKSYTLKNNISSRGAIISDGEENKNKIPPHLYAVMVGVSDYKGDELDLRFAAKDATDMSKAIKSSAGKLLGDDKVHVYNLTTEKERYSLPEKKAIQQTLTEIGSKASANDILLIFFAGHGVMNAQNKQFYFLTADASKATAREAVDKVGISTTELTDWIQPSRIKAQKRILILDACNSGQAIKDFVKMGSGDQNYLAARNDEKAAQIKAIDKLNEKSGLFILSASASDQSAYELGRFSQGLLTYSLLKAIKQQPDILEENKYLNVSRWFNAAEKTVSELAKETGARQDPQVISNSNFNMGVVDDEVRKGIALPEEKPLFAATRLFNADPGILSDDLGLSSLIDNSLNDFSARGTNALITFINSTSSPDAFSINGIYEITGNVIKCKINLRQNKETRNSFEITGTKEDLKRLAEIVTEKTTNWVKSNLVPKNMLTQ